MINTINLDLENNKLKLQLENFKNFSCLQVNTFDLKCNRFNGYEFSNFVQQYGIDAKFAAITKESSSDFVYSFNETKSYATDIIKSKIFHDTGIVHLHLIYFTNFFLSKLPLFTSLKPTVITLHCCFFFGGHCIYHFDCEKWKTHCHDCEYLDKPIQPHNDTSALNFFDKKQCIQNSNISVIVASEWMKQRAEQSPIWQGKTIYSVPFGINQNIFKPLNKDKAKEKLGIAPETFTIMFRAYDNLYKGLDLVKYALENISSDQKIALILIQDCGALAHLKDEYQITSFDWVYGDEQMAELYNAADLFLMPSTQETFGMMAIEAMSCAVPVLATKGTALEEIINAPQCGMVTEHNAEAYTKQLQEIIDNQSMLLNLSQKACDFAQKNYDFELYVQRLLAVYEDVIKQNPITNEAKLVLEQLQKHVHSKVLS